MQGIGVRAFANLKFKFASTLGFILRDAAHAPLLQRQRRSRCAGMRSITLVVRSAATPRVSGGRRSPA